MKITMANKVLEGGVLRRWAVLIMVLVTGCLVLPSMAATLHVPQDYPTIQAAVNAAASSGDEILIAPGVYTQQVLVTQKQLTLTGSPGTILQVWTGMKWEPPAPSYALVDIRTNADVAVRNIEFDGKHLAAFMPNGSAALIAVSFYGAGGRVENCVIQGFRGVANLGSAIIPPLGGRGVGVHAANARPGCKHVQILNNTFSDNGVSIILTGDYADPSLLRTTFIIEGNAITGVGPTTLDYQWGIGINPGAAGVIKRNLLKGHYHANPSGELSFGVLALGLPLALQPLRIEANTFRENEVHVLGLRADDAQIIHNIFEGSANGLECKGVYLTGSDIRVAINQFTNLAYGIVLADKNDPSWPDCGRAINPSVLANRFSCEVWTPLDVRPGVTGLIELGSECCSSVPPGFGNLTCSPAGGLPGTTVSLSGTNLASATAVLFNGLSADFTNGTDPDRLITATVPVHATTGPVTVITPQGNITSLAPFTVPVPLAMTLQPSGLVQLSWCADACDLVLECTSSVTTPDWQPVATSPAIGAEYVTWTGPVRSGPQFFRLRQP